MLGLLMAALLGSGAVSPGQPVTITTTDANQWVGVDIRVEAWDKPSVSVEQEPLKGDASLVGATIALERDRNGAQVVTAQYRGEKTTRLFGLIHDSANITVRWIVHVPMTSALRVESANDSIAVAGVVAPIHAHTSNGDVKIEGAGVSVDAGTSNGNVHVDVAKLSGAPQIEMHSSNGDVILRVPYGFSAHVTAHTSNGDVKNPFASATGAGSVTLGTSNGNAIVTVTH